MAEMGTVRGRKRKKIVEERGREIKRERKSRISKEREKESERGRSKQSYSQFRLEYFL